MVGSPFIDLPEEIGDHPFKLLVIVVALKIGRGSHVLRIRRSL